MKGFIIFLAASVALTLLFYVLAYNYMSSPPPSIVMLILFAGIAMVLVWVARSCVRRSR